MTMHIGLGTNAFLAIAIEWRKVDREEADTPTSTSAMMLEPASRAI